MTIASLDREIFEGEQRPSPKSCQEPVKTGRASGVAVRSQTRRNLVGDTPQPRQFPAILSVLFQLVRIRGTLLHEMIHCSDESLMGEIGVHAPDGSAGIFFLGCAAHEGVRRARDGAAACILLVQALAG